MRWQFHNPDNRLEAANRQAIVAKIDSWWREFEVKTGDIAALFSKKADWNLPDWMERHLQVIHPKLMWEYGPAVRGNGHRLVITPESTHHLRPLVRMILKRAPALDGWEFYEHRLAEDIEQTRATVEGRIGRDIADLKVNAARGAHHRIDLTYASPDFAGPEDHAAFDAAFVATETLLGEQRLNDWIGAIEMTVLPRASGLKSWFGLGRRQSPRFIELVRLREIVDALAGSICDQLPPTSHCEWVEGASWTMWKLQPEKADDYSDQHDLFVGKSANPNQWAAAHSGQLFSSQRFSRCKETFCYLKVDESQGLDEERFADKSEIEDALDAVLKPDKLGCHIGGGTGLRYSYIDLALTDVPEGIRAVRERLRAGNVPKRSWIQFFDSDLAAEWVGIYEDSPPPPMNLD
jgi:hypothetical protein